MKKSAVILRVTLESSARIAYAASVLPTEPVRPLHDVWLRPRRVFRDLSARRITSVDYLLGAAQGVAGWLALCRATNVGMKSSIADIFAEAVMFGSILGVASLLLYAAIYARLGVQERNASARAQVVHVLAYGGVPTAASLVIWVFTALLAGEATFEEIPRPDVEGFIAILLHAQFFTYVLLTLWSVVIQVMGLSEIRGVTTGKAFALWVLGQAIGVMALLFLVILIAILFPNAISS